MTSDDGRVVEIAQHLIAFDTTVGDPGEPARDERPCQEHIASLLEAAGFEVDLWEPRVTELRDHPMYLAGQNWHGRPNLVARLPGTGAGRSLIFNGHIDTVPAGNEDEWTSSPWTPEIRDGRLYGRGACDMKGGVAAMVDAALRISEGPRPSGDLLVMIVTDEEINGMGTIAALRRGYRAEAALVPEPTTLDVWIAFRGVLVGELEVVGRKGHVEVAQPHWSQGGAVNAVHEMVRTIVWLRELDDEWRDRPDKQHPLCTTGTVNVTTIEGGDFYGNVPERCRATLDVCYVPGEGDQDGYGSYVKRDIEDHLARHSTGWLREHPPTVRWLVDFPAAEISADEGVVRELVEVAATSHRRPRTLGLDTWDDTVSLIRAGIPSVSYGPGSNDQAHAIDEYVALGELRQCAATLERFARSWCDGEP